MKINVYVQVVHTWCIQALDTLLRDTLIREKTDVF